MSSDLAKIFGQKIRQVREQKRYSQEYLAELANLNRSYIGEIERGVVEPSLATMEKLAIALDPGKAYVQGYEIEKVSTEYVYIDKCRDANHIVQVDNAIIPQTVGNYVLVNTIQSAPVVDTFDTVDLYNRISQEGSVTLTNNCDITQGQTAFTSHSNNGAFTTELIAGSNIYNSSGIYVGTIASVTDDNHATLAAAAAVGSKYSPPFLIGARF